jgi:hypothetical protein
MDNSLLIHRGRNADFSGLRSLFLNERSGQDTMANGSINTASGLFLGPGRQMCAPMAEIRVKTGCGGCRRKHCAITCLAVISHKPTTQRTDKKRMLQEH